MSCIPRVKLLAPAVPPTLRPVWQVNMLCDACGKPHQFQYTGTRAQVDDHCTRYIRCEPCKQLNRGFIP